MNDNIYTVSELNDLIKKSLNTTFGRKTVKVTGEISNVRPSGANTYLTLKDNTGSISVIFWGETLKNNHGENVEISGRVDYYTKQGNMSIIGSSIKTKGIGSEHAEYERIKKEYEKKGYFNNKKPLPQSISKIGIVTSYTGAAIHDFLRVLIENGFSGDIYVYDSIVQGPKCPLSVASGIKFFNSKFYTDNVERIDVNKFKKLLYEDDDIDNDTDTDVDADADNDIDVDTDDTDDNIGKDNKPKLDSEDEVEMIIVMRGGGSFEDLIGFSHPKVLDALYSSSKYTISAVGHEIDNMLSDYVANHRTPTPSVAGEVVCSINNNNKAKVDKISDQVMNIKQKLINELYKFKEIIRDITHDYRARDPRVELNKKLSSLFDISKQHIYTNLLAYQKIIQQTKNILEKNNVNDMLQNGFMVVTNPDGNIITHIDDMINRDVYITNNIGRYNIRIELIDSEKNDKI